MIVAKSIATFEALSKTSVKTLQAISNRAGKRFNVHNPATWAKKAKLAASGDWAKLQKLQAELLGGKTK